LPFLTIIAWLIAPTTLHFHGIGITMNFMARGIQVLQPLTINTRILGFLIDLIPLLISETIIFFLIKLFRLYELGEIFSINNVKYIKYIGYALLIGQLLNPLYEVLMSTVLTWDTLHGRSIAISFSGANMAVILIAILTILVSWVMEEGCKLNEEQKYTI
jgi:hypothetical protein